MYLFLNIINLLHVKILEIFSYLSYSHLLGLRINLLLSLIISMDNYDDMSFIYIGMLYDLQIVIFIIF